MLWQARVKYHFNPSGGGGWDDGNLNPDSLFCPPLVCSLSSGDLGGQRKLLF